MKQIVGNKALFKIAATDVSHFPKAHYPQLVFCGRSNVGKSSLMNHLLRKKGLARTSSSPGRTATINFFLIDDAYYFVDLPGYGYASRSKKMRNEWKELIEGYFAQIPENALVLHLVDGRHPPFPDDISFYNWCKTLEKKPLVIFTKMDKIKKGEGGLSLPDRAKLLDEDLEYSTYSIRDPRSGDQLLRILNQKLSNG